MTPPRAAAAALLDRAADLAVVVVGDVALDEYLVGRPERLSREAPVPVLVFEERFCRPGGAANPAWNLARAGAEPRLVAVVGRDREGDELARLLAADGIPLEGLVPTGDRATTVKTRVVARGIAAPHQVARLDRESRSPVAGDLESAVVGALEAAATGAGAILVSDYKSGVVTAPVRAAARAAANAFGIWLTVDSQGDLERYAGFDLVRAALRDVETSLGRRLDSEGRIRAAAEELRRELSAKVVVVSRGAEGMSVVDESAFYTVAPTNLSEVYDVAGAGDTVIAYLTLALAAGAPLSTAVEMANRAAGLVVRRLGVAAPGRDELLAAYA